MAQKIMVELVDDLDGSVAEGTTTFGFEGKVYEIDLSASNAAAFGKVMAKYVGAARGAGKIGNTSGSPAKLMAKPNGHVGVSPAQVREWVSAQGFQMSPRGRVAEGIIQAFNAKDVDALAGILGNGPSEAVSAPETAQEDPAPTKARGGARKAASGAEKAPRKTAARGVKL